MKISLIFPTYQRPKDLEKALDSVLKQTLKPFEVCVIDQSEDDLSERICKLPKYKKINLVYIHREFKSIPKARQLWLDKTSTNTDIIALFDDDVVLKSDYLEQVALFMESHPDALMWWGKILNLPTKKSIFEDIWYFLFRNPIISNEFCNIDAQYKDPNKIQNVRSCIWCCMFIRKSIKEMGYRFPTRMERHAHAEDTFFSYQIYKDHPKSLFYVPNAQIYHYESPAGRILKSQRLNQTLYNRYIFRKKYKLPMRKYYRWIIGFLWRTLLKRVNRREIIKNFLRTEINIIKNSKKIQKNPEIVNTFIYQE